MGRLTADLHLSLHASESDPQVSPPISIADHLLQPPLPLHPCLQQITQIFCNLPPHSSFYPSPQLQQAFSGNPLGKPAKEASRTAKQVGELQIFTLSPPLHIQSPSLIPSTTTECQLHTSFPLPTSLVYSTDHPS